VPAFIALADHDLVALGLVFLILLSPGAAVFIVGAATLTLSFNFLLLPRIIRTLTFLAGDVFGLMICTLELALAIFYAVCFVRV
jgi:cobalamin synthase